MKGWNTGLETAVKVPGAEPGSNHVSMGWVQNLKARNGWWGGWVGAGLFGCEPLLAMYHTTCR